MAEDATFAGRLPGHADRLTLKAGRRDDLWLMYNDAVWHRTVDTDHWTLADTIAGQSNFFTDLAVDTRGDAWVGTSWSGLRHIDAATLRAEHIDKLTLEDRQLLHNDIQTVGTDAAGDIWVGTLNQGLLCYNPRMFPFHLVQTVAGRGLRNNESVRSIFEDTDGSILIGTTNHGLFRYRAAPNAAAGQGQAEAVRPDLLGSDIVLCVSRDRAGDLWVGTYLGGFYRFTKQGVRRYNCDNAPNAKSTQNISRAVYQDPAGHYWVSVRNKSVGRLDPVTGRIDLLSARHPRVAAYGEIYGFYPVSRTTFAAYGKQGIFYYDTAKDRVYAPAIDRPDDPKHAGLHVAYNHVMRDSRGLVWFATDHGLRVWDGSRARAYDITTADGLPHNEVSASVEDGRGGVWVATAVGISRIDVETDSRDRLHFRTTTFDATNGLSGGRTATNVALKARDGSIWFGTFNGSYQFAPKDFYADRPAPPAPLVTGISVFGRSIAPYEEFGGRVVLDRPVNRAGSITLNHDENYLTLRFVCPDFANGPSARYRYRLSGYDSGWTEIEATGTAAVSYTGLPSGSYTFEVSAADKGGRWSREPASLGIIVRPPFWATPIAYIIYIALSAAALWWLWRLYRERRILVPGAAVLRTAEQQVRHVLHIYAFAGARRFGNRRPRYEDAPLGCPR